MNHATFHVKISVIDIYLKGEIYEEVDCTFTISDFNIVSMW